MLIRYIEISWFDPVNTVAWLPCAAHEMLRAEVSSVGEICGASAGGDKSLSLEFTLAAQCYRA